MRPQRRNRLLAVVLSAATASTLLAGCSAADQSAPAVGEPKSGGTVTYLEPQAFSGLYPPAAGFYPNGSIVNNLTDRLLYQNPETLELEPWIASALPAVNADATEYTFSLREGVTYSDGTPLDAANVVKNFDLYGKGDKQRKLTVSEALNNYDHAEAVDEHTVRFHFSAPAPGFAQATSTINSGLLSNATLDRDSEGFAPGQAKQIVGSGPFVVTDEQLNTEYTLTAREGYDWAPPSLAHQGRARVDAVKVVVTPESSIRVGTLVAGQADVARQIDPPDEAQVTGAGQSLHVASTNGIDNALQFRFRDRRLSDIRVRQALIAAVDRQQILDQLYTASYPLATSPLAKSALGYKDESAAYRYDRQRARDLLDEAGWHVGDDGIRTKDGERLTLTVNHAIPLPRSKELVTILQEQLKEVGVEVRLFQGDQAAQNAAALDQDTVQVYHQMVGRADYDVIKSQYSGDNRNVFLNLDKTDGSYGDPHLEELLRAVASKPSAEERQRASEAVQDYVTEQAYVLPIYEEPLVYGTSSAVQGFDTESVGRPSFYSLWLNR
ncbi:TIGR04028 family ABC transporter substrate-binding protein [Pseudoclavibacter sp. CFCC 13796]|uniref:TIGR04028 family ABC transporter substrate-binding protein n=1 Tax=Pseudoclavibacter sp. CFCC 13796 TaxID=2615179 RepID=UPI00130198C3|nr:TIGR04028 family ABC transporter substrate-binding protein [Pseudoclavibacter sp. CFCC 13796]KAB1661420.1 TIGR04028 family ABC transporter substrate-binding protein [Pseudoclavibacter sp. CFCC 13796]